MCADQGQMLTCIIHKLRRQATLAIWGPRSILNNKCNCFFLIILLGTLAAFSTVTMAGKASGRQLIEHKSYLIDHIGEHFNNPDVSDVTLTVGDQVFTAHRLVLATQSKVFHRMLLSENWKESFEKKVSLEESPQGMSAFSDFLKFFYTGKLTLTISNVCGIHILADKYDVPILKNDCLGFMKDVLSGVHGDALQAEWLQYIESFVPDMLSACYSAIRTNFVGIANTNEEYYKLKFMKLRSDQIKSILCITCIQDELVLVGENTLISIFEEKKWRNELLPYVRFANIDVDRLHKYYENKMLKKYCNEAYKVHAERSSILGKGCKRQRMSEQIDEVMCPCVGNDGYPCPHINPRLYIPEAGEMSTVGDSVEEPVDLSNLTRFSQKMVFSEDSDHNAEWHTHVQGIYTEDPIYETFSVEPALSHVGRRFTLAIMAGYYLSEEKKDWKYRYCIKFTGIVTAVGNKTDVIKLNSPLREKGCWEMNQNDFYGNSIVLHKQ